MLWALAGVIRGSRQKAWKGCYKVVFEGNATNLVQGVYFHCPSTEKLIEAGLGVSRTIYVNVDSPDLGFPYFNFLGGYQ